MEPNISALQGALKGLFEIFTPTNSSVMSVTHDHLYIINAKQDHVLISYCTMQYYNAKEIYTTQSYLIFVTNATNAVRVKFLAECKKNLEKRENYCFGLNLYHNSDHVNVLFYTKCAILHRYQCFILHLVFDFTLGV